MNVVAALVFTLCTSQPIAPCVTDGDTFRIGADKIRIANIDAPELRSPQCEAERILARKATWRLLELLNSGNVTIHRSGRDRDRYGRLLRSVRVNGKNVGAILVSEGLARRWTGKREPWCG